MLVDLYTYAYTYTPLGPNNHAHERGGQPKQGLSSNTSKYNRIEILMFSIENSINLSLIYALCEVVVGLKQAIRQKLTSISSTDTLHAYLYDTVY